jgi:hypothetical protein
MGLVLVALALAAASGGRAQAPAKLPEVYVKGWNTECGKPPCPPTAVQVYSADGQPQGDKKPWAGAAIVGKHVWNPEFNLVKLAPDVWVRSRALQVEYCTAGPATGATAMPHTGGASVQQAMGMGSGAGCAQ